MGFVVDSPTGPREAWVNRGLPVSAIRRPTAPGGSFGNGSATAGAPTHRRFRPQAQRARAVAGLQPLGAFWYSVAVLEGDVVVKSYTQDLVGWFEVCAAVRRAVADGGGGGGGAAFAARGAGVFGVWGALPTFIGLVVVVVVVGVGQAVQADGPGSSGFCKAMWCGSYRLLLQQKICPTKITSTFSNTQTLQPQVACCNKFVCWETFLGIFFLENIACPAESRRGDGNPRHTRIAAPRATRLGLPGRTGV